MTTVLERRRRAHVAAAAVMSAAALVGGLLDRFSPQSYGFYPQCPFHGVTGWLCPGCGATRALAALVHGDVAGAWHWNALVVTLLPALVLWGVVAYVQACAGRELPRVPRMATAMLLVCAVAFGIVRNLV